MKKLFVLILMLVVVSQAFSQKKKKAEEIVIDSLTKANSALTLQMDSISQDLDLYQGMYTTVKEKVFKYDFDPSNISTLIDSIRASSDSTALGLAENFETLNDSISLLKSENDKLQKAVDSLMVTGSNKDELVEDLEQLKKLLDSQIITQEEFDSKKTLILDKWK